MVPSLKLKETFPGWLWTVDHGLQGDISKRARNQSNRKMIILLSLSQPKCQLAFSWLQKNVCSPFDFK